jgi:hypothetical protein
MRRRRSAALIALDITRLCCRPPWSVDLSNPAWLAAVKLIIE